MPPLSSDARRALLVLARQAIVETVVHRRVLDSPMLSGELSLPGAAFVTVRHGRKLRGCVGRIDRSLALGEVVAQCAIGAVLRDPRFPAVKAGEVADLEIEISVLSELCEIAASQVVPGVHGLVVQRDRHRGLLLPQVAAERHWSAEQLLAETCQKAGLQADAWRDSGTQVLGFTAEVFEESDFPGP